jgi:hypothetical protein
MGCDYDTSLLLASGLRPRGMAKRLRIVPSDVLMGGSPCLHRAKGYATVIIVSTVP